MALTSMTGFARTQGRSGTWTWAWELKSVNGKGFDLRLRLPAGWDAVEAAVRAAAPKRIARGSVNANLTATREGVPATVRINQDVLAAMLKAVADVAAQVDARAPSLDGILGLKGVVEIVEMAESEEERRVAEAALLSGFEAALAALADMRQTEGAALARILNDRLDAIETLVRAAEENPGRKPEAIKARLAEQIRTLLDTGAKFDADRLHQEAILLASKADVREELDRLHAHIAAARAMIAAGGAVGRKLDFLAQEFNRETNTLCSKSNDIVLTSVGLELKSIVEQFREQVQNVE